MKIRDIFFDELEGGCILGYIYITTACMKIYRGLVAKDDKKEDNTILHNIFGKKIINDLTCFVEVKRIPKSVKSIKNIENAKIIKNFC